MHGKVLQAPLILRNPRSCPRQSRRLWHLVRADTVHAIGALVNSRRRLEQRAASVGLRGPRYAENSIISVRMTQNLLLGSPSKTAQSRMAGLAAHRLSVNPPIPPTRVRLFFSALARCAGENFVDPLKLPFHSGHCLLFVPNLWTGSRARGNT